MEINSISIVITRTENRGDGCVLRSTLKTNVNLIIIRRKTSRRGVSADAIRRASAKGDYGEKFRMGFIKFGAGV